MNSVGFGFGPEVVRVRNSMPGLSGFASYFVPVFRAFARFRPPRFEVRARGFSETGYMMMVEVCNGTTAGGSYRFAPGALPGDGRQLGLSPRGPDDVGPPGREHLDEQDSHAAGRAEHQHPLA